MWSWSINLITDYIEKISFKNWAHIYQNRFVHQYVYILDCICTCLHFLHILDLTTNDWNNFNCEFSTYSPPAVLNTPPPPRTHTLTHTLTHYSRAPFGNWLLFVLNIYKSLFFFVSLVNSNDFVVNWKMIHIHMSHTAHRSY